MAPTPTVQKPSMLPEKRIPRPMGGGSGNIERKSDLVMRVKYTNTLPDLPFDPKFISYPFDHNRFVTYSTTSLERNYVYDILTEPDLGVEVELVIPNFYNLPPNAPPPQLDPKDEKLLEEDIQPQKNQKRSKHHAKSVSWLRRTEYISTEQTRFQPQSIEKVESKVGFGNIKKKLTDEWHYSDRDSQIKAIEKTFEDAIQPIGTHFAKPGVVPVEVLPVFPDFKLWKYPCAQVIFDSDPAPVGRPMPAQLEEMSQAMIRGVMDESGEQFVAYFLPSEETLAKRRRDVELDKEYFEDDSYEYRMAREYNWNVKSKATKGFEENFFFVIRDDGVYYNELETRVRLNKRRTRGPNQQLNTKLCVKHVPLASSDYKFQRNRERELEALVEEDEDEKSDNETGGGKSDDDKSDKSDDKSGKSDDEKSNKSDKSDSDDSDKEDKRKLIKSKSATIPPQKKKNTMNIQSGSEDSDVSSDAAVKSDKPTPGKSKVLSDNDGGSDSSDSDKGSPKGSSGKSASSAASDSD